MIKNRPETLIFDRDPPPPRKGKQSFLNARRSYVVGKEKFRVSFVLSCMEVGESCLLSNWATASVNYVQKKLGRKYQRQLQADGTVRVWRIK